jgi:hypothetical protein
VGIAITVTASNTSLACWTPLALLALTSWLVGRRQGAAIVGVEKRGKAGVLVIDAGGVSLHLGKEAARFAREDIVAGWTETLTSDTVVLATRSGALLRAEVGSAEQAAQVLRAAGVSADQRAVELRLGVPLSPGRRALHVFLAITTMLLFAVFACVGLALLVIGQAAPAVAVFGALMVVTLAALAIVVRPLLTTTLRIGTDGVAVKRLWGNEFIARAELGVAETYADHLVLNRRGRASLRIPTSSVTEAAAVAARIREAMADRGSGAAAALLSRLDRQGRPIGAWLADVRAAAREEGGYRAAAIDGPALLDVVEDAGAPIERRIAAATAIGGARDGDARARVRIAAAACADDRLRIALHNAAEGSVEEEQVEEAIRAEQAAKPQRP